MKRKRKRKKGTTLNKEEKFQESTGRHIVVVDFDNETISDITIIDAEDGIFKGLINKSLFN